MIAGDRVIDDSRDRLEERGFELLATQQPVAGDLRMLVATLRMVADLERMGDLAVHVAKIARMRMPEQAVPPALRPTIANMAETAERMVGETARILANRDVDAALALEAEDEEMDRLRRSMFRILLDDDWAHGVEPAIDLALLGRYYERIADHSVSMARRVVYLVTGEHPAPMESTDASPTLVLDRLDRVRRGLRVEVLAARGHRSHRGPARTAAGCRSGCSARPRSARPSRRGA